MTDHATLVAQVTRYFAAVDQQDLAALLGCLTEDCVFRVETHNVELQGHAVISGMFERLWAEHAAVKHHRFHHVADPAAGRIASQFQVVNTLPDGSLVHKSNSNFFTDRGGRFSAVSVYMSGENTLE